jgi:hypothetical protein
MDYGRFAVQRLNYDAREKFVWPKFAGLGNVPLRQNERVSTVVGCFPINGKPTQIESGIEAHNECLRLNRHSENFFNELCTGIQAQAITAIVRTLRLRGFHVFPKHVEFVCAESMVVMEYSLLRAYVLVSAQFAKSPEAEG